MGIGELAALTLRGGTIRIKSKDIKDDSEKRAWLMNVYVDLLMSIGIVANKLSEEDKRWLQRKAIYLYSVADLIDISCVAPSRQSKAS